MTRCLTRLRRWRRRADAERPLDPTRPHPVVRDGVPIVHEGPPGFPGRSEAVASGDGERGDGER